MIRQSVLLLALVLCGVSAIQPGCRTRFEMRTRWTVQGVANRYWECSRWGNAVQRTCPQGTLFAQPFQTCVPQRVWEEFPYYPPPTTVDDYANECMEDEDQECIDPCVEVPCEGGVVVDGKCVRCIGGQWIDDQCVCFGNAVLVDGICKDEGEVEDCGEFGFWDAIEQRCLCYPGYESVEGVCTAGPAVIDCEKSNGVWDKETGECVCPVGTQLVNGRCTTDPVVIDCSASNGVWSWETNECECPDGYLLVNGKCTNNPVIIDCVQSNGVWDEATQTCVCPEGYVLHNGKCTNDRLIVDCLETGGTWDDVLKQCVCPDNKTLINGWCVSSMGICDGAPDSAYVRGTRTCDPPACTEEEYWTNYHWPTRNPRTFWQCSGVNWLQERPCAAGTCFQAARQTCVHVWDWYNECA